MAQHMDRPSKADGTGRTPASMIKQVFHAGSHPTQTIQGFWVRTDETPDGGVLLLEQRAEFLVQVPRLLRQLGVPQAHAAARLVNQVDGLVGQEPAMIQDSAISFIS